jgi:hypothetical protein
MNLFYKFFNIQVSSSMAQAGFWSILAFNLPFYALWGNISSLS